MHEVGLRIHIIKVLNSKMFCIVYTCSGNCSSYVRIWIEFAKLTLTYYHTIIFTLTLSHWHCVCCHINIIWTVWTHVHLRACTQCTVSLFTLVSLILFITIVTAVQLEYMSLSLHVLMVEFCVWYQSLCTRLYCVSIVI